MLPRVCIIGAGPAGVIAYRHFKEFYNVTVYEASDRIGGLWNYVPETDETTPEDDPYK
jgi:cation diffusion facilitator CzcD-associated flavoprotein CzcO